MIFRFDRFLTLYFFHPLLRKKGLPYASRIPILMYHSISEPISNNTHPYYETCTAPAVFTRHMQFLKDQGYQVIELTDLEKFLTPGASNNSEPVIPAKTGIQSSDKKVILTFDDGFQDFLTHAFPILKSFHFPATVFLPTSFVGNEKRRSFKDKPCLTWPEIKTLHDQGITFGSHTETHPRLYDHPLKTIKKELTLSKEKIEHHLRVPVTTFAYPFAFPQADNAFRQKLDDLLQGIGYQFCVTTKISGARDSDNRYCLPRVPVNSLDDIDFFRAKLEDAYDWLGKAQLIVKKWKLRIQPPKHRRIATRPASSF